MKNLTLSTRLALGFGAILAITVLIGGLAVWSGREASTQSTHLARVVAPINDLSGAVADAAADAVFRTRGYLLFRGDEDRTRAIANLDEAAAGMQEIATLAAAHGLDDLAARARAASEQGRRYHEQLADYFALVDRFDQQAAAAASAADQLVAETEAVTDGLLAGSSQAAGLRSAAAAVGITTARYLADRTDAGHEAAAAAARTLTDRLAGIPATIPGGSDPRLARLADLARAHAGHLAGLAETDAAKDENDRRRAPMYRDLLAGAEEQQAWASAQVNESAARSARTARQNTRLAMGGVAAALLLGSLLGWLVTRGVTRTLAAVIADLTRGAEQTASASQQISASSQALAESASEAAASIEETSSSVEELTAMTEKNTRNAARADGLMGEAKTLVGSGHEAMQRLAAAMTEIKDSADETARIVKTIDEIAFQTNLLALNAAVEAARAGDAGKGFAVVAEEVRNLAQRSAEAARNTSRLIERSVERTESGVTASAETNQAFAAITTSAAEVAEIVAEIAAASQQQTMGIEQINQAMAEMNRVTQGNASGAEESASAAQELSAQAVETQRSIADLAALMGGVRGRDGGRDSGRDRRAGSPRGGVREGGSRAPSAAAWQAGGQAAGQAAGAGDPRAADRSRPAPSARSARSASDEDLTVLALDEDDLLLDETLAR